MAKMTSAYANKVLKKLNEDKEFWLEKEQAGSMYIAATGEEPVIPEYDYAEVAEKIAEIDEKILKIKHAINVSNATTSIKVGDEELTVDIILVKLAQLNRRKATLDFMRKQQPKSRISSGMFGGKSGAAEYQYINYDMEQVQRDYDSIDSQIAEMQIALDKHNQTFEFEVGA